MSKGSTKGAFSSRIAQAVAKILDASRNRRISVEKCAEQVARALADVDPAGAAEVRAAMARQKEGPSLAMLGSMSDSAPVEWHAPEDLSEDLILEPTANKCLMRLADELAHTSRILAAGIDAPTRILFSGPSGTGKTLAVRWLGGKLGIPVAIVRLDRVVSSYLGETAGKVAKAMEAADSCPSILFFDEVDGMCARRDKDQDVGEIQRVTSALFQQIDALPARQIVVAATNFKDHVDPALLRRLPSQVAFALPSEKAREAMIRRWWFRVDHVEPAIRVAVAKTAGRSGAETRSLAMATARMALLAGDAIDERHVLDVLTDGPHAVPRKDETS